MKCKAVTNGIVFRNNGTIVPCCVFQPSKQWTQTIDMRHIKSVDNYYRSHQLKLLNDDFRKDYKNPQCKSCWQLEETGAASWRQICNSQLPDSPEGKDMLVEVRLGNVCNFRCYTCSPTSSSKIQKDWLTLADGTLFKEITIKDWTKDEHNVKVVKEFLSRAKRISFMGGEPFLNKQLLHYLSPLVGDTNIEEISITTNGSFVPFNLLVENFSNLLLTFSIDAIDNLSEYVRFESSWLAVKANFEESIRRGIRTHVGLTLSLYNLFALPETLKYINSQKPNYIHFNFVNEPDFMSISQLPPYLMQKAIDMLHTLDKNINIEHALSIVGSKYTPEKYKQFLEYTEKLDSLRGVSLSTFVPQYYI